MARTQCRKFFGVLAAAATLLLGAPSAGAVIIDFDTYVPETDPVFELLPPVIELDGFRIESSVNLFGAYFQLANSFHANADPTGHTLGHNYPNQTSTITRSGGGLFDALSIDMADVSNIGNPVSVLIESNFGFFTVVLDHLVGLQTISLDLTNISFLNITPQSAYIQLDNMNLTSAGPTPVPIPVSLPMLISAVVGTFVFARKRMN